MMISVIIPTYNEADHIVPLIKHLQKHGGRHLEEIIVSDGGSADDTAELAHKAGAKSIINNQLNRASQLNFGASQASGEILYFVHADTLPPTNFTQAIISKHQAGHRAGNFISRFNSSSAILKLNQFFNRFNFLFFRGGGDQSLFVEHQLYHSMKGYDEHFVIMEDFDLVKRLRKKTNFAAIEEEVLVSDRKYQRNSYLRTSFAYCLTCILFFIKVPPSILLKIYQHLICNQRYFTSTFTPQKEIRHIGNYCQKSKEAT